MVKVSDHLSVDNWPIRRRWMRVILAWAMINAEYLMIWGEDNALHQNALVTLLGLIVAIAGSYIFGAVWDDNDKRKWRHQRVEPEIGE